jgi:photosystem II stability/assembly factor-like uncharacterized protein
MIRPEIVENTALRWKWAMPFGYAAHPALAVCLFITFALPFYGLSSEIGSVCSRGNPRTNVVFASNVVVRLDGGRLQSSFDSLHWTNHSVRFRTFFRDVTCVNGLFVAVGGSYFGEPGVIITSRDGVAWTRRNHDNMLNLYGVASGSDLFVAVGERGAVFSSKDGIRWRKESSGASGLLASVAFGNSTFVAGGESGLILTSTNGSHWTTHKLPSHIYVGAIQFSEGHFTVRSCSTNFVSLNGADWHVLPSPCAVSSELDQ